MEKFPNAPIGENPADCGAPDHGDDGPIAPGTAGPVTVRFNVPKGEAESTSVLGLLFPSSFSSRLKPPSLKSVLRRMSEGGGDET